MPKCYTTEYSVWGADENGEYHEFVSDTEYLESLEEEQPSG